MSKSNQTWFISIALFVAVSVILIFRPNHTAVRSALQPTKLSRASEAENLQKIDKSQSTEGIPLANTMASAAVPDTPLTAKRPIVVERPVLDPEFVAAAARPYVEAWERKHRTTDKLDWSQSKVVFFPAPATSIEKGYIGVFFPNDARPGFGFACFNVNDDAQDHLKPMAWGYVPELNRALKHFRRGATEGDFPCSYIGTSIVETDSDE